MEKKTAGKAWKAGKKQAKKKAQKLGRAERIRLRSAPSSLHSMTQKANETQIKVKNLEEIKPLAKKSWTLAGVNKFNEHHWKIVVQKAQEKKLKPSQLIELIKNSKHPAEVFVR
ncbi:MAG TPA: hypothetical protein VJK05_04475 [archaeon]|nr:hypothetical protein [archaeon]